jgi:serine/threonine-protein kinase
MELLSGVTLDQYLTERVKLTLGEAIPILRSLARALDAAHAKGIAHRDLKPENVFISQDDDGSAFPKLLDFGIAKLLASDAQLQHKTRTGAPIGTPYYMSPEQCRGRDVDHRTDIYSFGIMIYQILTGQLPFTGQDFMEILLKQISANPTPPSQLADLPAEVDERILWFLKKDPAERPPNLVSGVRALEDSAQAVGVPLPAAGSAMFATQPTPNPSGMRSIPSPTPNRLSSEARALGNASTIAAGPTPGYLAAEASAAPKPRGGKMGLVAGAAVAVTLAAAGAYFLLRPSGPASRAGATPPDRVRPEPAAQVARPAADTTAPELPTATPAPKEVPGEAAPAAVTPAAGAATAALPATIALDVQGVPNGTEILGPDGTVLGTGPGKVQIARSDQPLALGFRAKGYKAETREVIPREDASLSVELKKKGSPSARKQSPDHKKPGKDDIEDAF